MRRTRRESRSRALTIFELSCNTGDLPVLLVRCRAHTPQVNIRLEVQELRRDHVDLQLRELERCALNTILGKVSRKHARKAWGSVHGG